MTIKKKEALSDDEEEKNVKDSVVRKADLLDIDNSDDEFQIKSGCTRKKSADFNREKQCHLDKGGSRFELMRLEEMQKASKMRKQTMYIKRRKE